MQQQEMFPELVKAIAPKIRKTDSKRFTLNQQASANLEKFPLQARQMYSALKSLSGEIVTGKQIRELLETGNVIQTRQDPYRIFQYYQNSHLAKTGVITEIK